MAAAGDYAWFETEVPLLATSFCLTWVSGLEPDEALRRMGTTSTGSIAGVDALCDAMYDLPQDDRSGLGATTVDGWVLIVEPNGYRATDEAVQRGLSAGTEALVVWQNINAHSQLTHVVDGVVRTSFDPLFPSDRDGSAPDALLDLMIMSGFDLDAEDSDDNGTEAALALAENLTGVRLTAEFLNGARFLGGVVSLS